MGWIVRTFVWECFWGFYSSVESTHVPWAERPFLIMRILINVRISWDSSHTRVPWPRPNVERKIFPFKIPWSSLKPYGCHVALTLVALVSILQGFHPYRTTCHAFFPSRTLICHLKLFSVVRLMYPSYLIFIPFKIQHNHMFNLRGVLRSQYFHNKS